MVVRGLPERRAPAALVLLAAAAICGCHDSEVSRLPLPDHDYFFLVTLDASELITAVSAAYAVGPSGGLAFGGPTEVPLSGADRAVLASSWWAGTKAPC